MIIKYCASNFLSGLDQEKRVFPDDQRIQSFSVQAHEVDESSIRIFARNEIVQLIPSGLQGTEIQ